MIELNSYEFLEPYKVTLNIANFSIENSKNIEEFERTVIKYSDEFERHLLIHRTLLVNLGYKVDSLLSPGTSTLAPEPAKKPANPPKKANIIPNANINNSKKLFEPYLPVYRNRTGHSFLDDEELL